MNYFHAFGSSFFIFAPHRSRIRPKTAKTRFNNHNHRRSPTTNNHRPLTIDQRPLTTIFLYSCAWLTRTLWHVSSCLFLSAFFWAASWAKLSELCLANSESSWTRAATTTASITFLRRLPTTALVYPTTGLQSLLICTWSNLRLALVLNSTSWVQLAC